ncbi:ABC transporter ATP-binding protein [Bacillus sp. FJAT-49711]|uniref:ABC transporter ATP-binding protein n=1 Tax=Bacillus sp. FJAT-49711 TaxID=2833585 RepID=UPI001BC971B1|nr:ABC transporter ATP-binding protein [Bacillus sp. FJAT-49711]MBS4219002.1 ABC transporter ATP-binding protein [Bacillus sp. FJAT-49711]
MHAKIKKVTNLTASLIEIQELSVEFQSSSNQKITALDNVNLSINKDEFICVMGPSGCGKTTLLNTIAGMQGITSGSITIDGRNIEKPSPERAVVFQDDAVFPWMTVEENIGFSLSMQKKSKQEIKESVDHFLELVKLEDFRNAWPKQLSGGMRKRVDIARAYAANPKVLLLDEPFGPLDIMTKEHLQEELRKLWMQAPRTVIFITHDLEEALFLGDRIVVMTPRPGKIHSIYKPNFPKSRDMSIKTSASFVDYRKRIRAILKQEEESLEGGES